MVDSMQSPLSPLGFASPPPPNIAAPPVRRFRSLSQTPAIEQNFPLTSLLKKLQVHLEHYFSDENLEVDFFMLKNLDADHFVPVELFASFAKIKKLAIKITATSFRPTTVTGIVLMGLRQSPYLELNADETLVRRTKQVDNAQTYQGYNARCIFISNISNSTLALDLEMLLKRVGKTVNVAMVHSSETQAHWPSTLARGMAQCAIAEYETKEVAYNTVKELAHFQGFLGSHLDVRLANGHGADELARSECQNHKEALSSFLAEPRVPQTSSLKIDSVEHGIIASLTSTEGSIHLTKMLSVELPFQPSDAAIPGTTFAVGDHISFTVGFNAATSNRYAKAVKLQYRPDVKVDWTTVRSSSVRPRASTLNSAGPGMMYMDQSMFKQRPPLVMTRSNSVAFEGLRKGRSSSNAALLAPSEKLFSTAEGPDGTRGFRATPSSLSSSLVPMITKRMSSLTA